MRPFSRLAPVLLAPAACTWTLCPSSSLSSHGDSCGLGSAWVRRALVCCLFVVSTLSAAVRSAAAPAFHTTPRLVLSHETTRPGDTIWAAVQLRMDPEYHTYWQNSGDSGIPTKIDWHLPAGLTAGEILWPTPERFELSGLVTYGYQGEVALLVPLSVAPGIPAGPLDLSAQVSWLECIVERCVPAGAEVTAHLAVASETKPSPDAKLFDDWKKKLPASKPDNAIQAWWDTTDASEAVRALLLEWAVAPEVVDGDFYVSSTNAVVRTTVQKLEAPAGRLRLRKEVEKGEGNAPGGWPAQLSGLLIEKAVGAGPARAYHATFPIQTSPGTIAAAVPAAPASAAPKKPLLAWLGAAFLGGLILNLMPCVLPVIALKIFGFVGQSREAPGRVRRLGFVYMLGVVTSFLVLAGAVIGLKGLGKQVSWGMQFGDVRFLVIMTILAMLVALNLFGLFEVTLGSGTLTKASALAAHEGVSGAFFNGVLATLLSTPCSAPFLAGALGFAFAQPSGIIVLIFVTIGLGLAAPYVALSCEPRWLKFLPKPGVWMERFRNLMGFPMLATAVWLFTLTVDHYGEVLWLGFFLVILALAAWTFGQFVQRGEKRRGLAVAFTLGLLVFGYAYALEHKQRWRTPRPAAVAGGDNEIIKEGPDGIEWRRWSSARVEQARSEGRPILVDFTAKWCATCNVNKNTSIEIDSVRKKLKEINAVALLGDYTLVPDDITRELARFHRAAVPLVLVYPKDPSKPAIELPDGLLTPQIVLDALNQAAK